MGRARNRALRWSMAGDRSGRIAALLAEPDPEPRESAVPDGWSLADIDTLARMGMSRSWARGCAHADRYAAAWHAVAMEVVAADSPPDRVHLLWLAERAARDEIRAHKRHHGSLDDITPDRPVGDHRPQFARYWAQSVIPDHGPAVVERMALRQIWPRLPHRHRQTLIAYALADNDQDAAADALGIPKAAYQYRIQRARAAALELWHDGERPSRIWRQDSRRPRSTAPCGTHAGCRRHRSAGEEPCEPCRAAERAYDRDRRAARRARSQGGLPSASEVA